MTLINWLIQIIIWSCNSVTRKTNECRTSPNVSRNPDGSAGFVSAAPLFRILMKIGGFKRSQHRTRTHTEQMVTDLTLQNIHISNFLLHHWLRNPCWKNWAPQKVKHRQRFTFRHKEFSAPSSGRLTVGWPGRGWHRLLFWAPRFSTTK